VETLQLGTVFGLLTAFFTMLTAVGGLIVTWKVFLPNKRTNEETHKIVNQQRTDMLRFQTVLINTLGEHGIAIPEDQSKVND
jgi:hypothetical protein